MYYITHSIQKKHQFFGKIFPDLDILNHERNELALLAY